MNVFSRHIPVRKLTEYLTGDLSLLKRVDVESHVGICSRCAGKLTKLERLIAQIRIDTLQDTHASISDRAVQMLRSKKSRFPVSSDVLHRVLAVLRFDSAGLVPSFGVRSGNPGTRQLLFSAGADQIDLRIEPADQNWTVSGQILGASPVSGRAILQNTLHTNKAPLNELSEFVLAPVQAGIYKLILKLETAEIEIEEIRVGP